MAGRESVTTEELLAKRDKLLDMSHKVMQDGTRLPPDLFSRYMRILNNKPFFHVSDKATPLQFLEEYERQLQAFISRRQGRRGRRGNKPGSHPGRE